jgi:hypothetical protein
MWPRIYKGCLFQGRTRIWLARGGGGLRQDRVLTPESCTDLALAGGWDIDIGLHHLHTHAHNDVLFTVIEMYCDH